MSEDTAYKYYQYTAEMAIGFSDHTWRNGDISINIRIDDEDLEERGLNKILRQINYDVESKFSTEDNIYFVKCLKSTLVEKEDNNE